MASTPSSIAPESRAARRHHLRRRGVAAAAAAVAACAIGSVAIAQLTDAPHAGPQGNGTAITPVGWRVTPAGRQLTLGERPYGMALSPDGRSILVSNNGVDKQSLMSVDPASQHVAQTISYDAPEALFLGVAFSPDGTKAYAAAGSNDKIRTYDVHAGQLDEGPSIPLDTTGHPFPAGLAVAPDGKRLFVADNLANALSIIDLASGHETRVALSDRTCTIGDWGDTSNGRDCLFPYTAVVSHDGGTVFVSNWGQRTVSVVDTATARATATIKVGQHPSAMTLSADGSKLYVANTDSDSVSVVDTATSEVVRTIELRRSGRSSVGRTPNSLALAPGGRTLYVAEAGGDDIAVVRLKHGRGADAIAGRIPTGWYPTGVAVDPGGTRLYVANAKGLGAGPNPHGPKPTSTTPTDPDQYIGSMIQGTLSTIAVPDDDRLAAYTKRVSANHHSVGSGTSHGNSPLPTQHDQTSPIKHVIYIVNENRTYDQVLGDLPAGNGDPSLTLFGRDITPNHHRLAKQFTTIDNLYAAGEVSDDGWEWSTAAEANTLTQKTMPTLYGGRGYFYAGEGGTLAAAPGLKASDSYIWNLLDDAGLSYRNYGFWATDKPPVQVYNQPSLAAHTDRDYAGFNMQISDQDRFATWSEEFRGYVNSGELPTVEFLKFPRDHTCGTSPSCPTPQAMVADSDLALGKLVDAVSHSKFWKSTAIFVVEDDAQDGPDHVDAHRTVAHVISPYTQLGGKVDSTFYSSASILRTMELILGLRPLTRFDARANPMRASFTSDPNFAPYGARSPLISLKAMNARTAPLAAASSQMNFRREDQAPEALLNQAIWQSVRGRHSRMPAPRHRVLKVMRHRGGDADG